MIFVFLRRFVGFSILFVHEHRSLLAHNGLSLRYQLHYQSGEWYALCFLTGVGTVFSVILIPKSSPDPDSNASYHQDYAYTKCWVEGGGRFGDFSCDSPWRLVQSALAFVATYTRTEIVGQGAQRPFVLWTG